MPKIFGMFSRCHNLAKEQYERKVSLFFLLKTFINFHI